MSNVVEYIPRSIPPNSLGGSGDGGGYMDDILRRLGIVETFVSEMRVQVGQILTLIPHLATKADVANLRTELKEEIGGLRAELKQDIGEVKTSLAALETSIIKWMIGTVLTAASLAFTIAKLVH